MTPRRQFALGVSVLAGGLALSVRAVWQTRHAWLDAYHEMFVTHQGWIGIVVVVVGVALAVWAISRDP